MSALRRLLAALVVGGVVSGATVGVAAPALAFHQSAFVCQPERGVTRYVLNRGADSRIKADKPAEGIYIERRDGTGYWRTLDQSERRIVLFSARPLRAVHGLQVKPGIVGYDRVEDLPKRDGRYAVRSEWRLRATVLTTECR